MHQRRQYLHSTGRLTVQTHRVRHRAARGHRQRRTAQNQAWIVVVLHHQRNSHILQARSRRRGSQVDQLVQLIDCVVDQRQRARRGQRARRDREGRLRQLEIHTLFSDRRTSTQQHRHIDRCCAVQRSGHRNLPVVLSHPGRGVTPLALDRQPQSRSGTQRHVVPGDRLVLGGHLHLKRELLRVFDRAAIPPTPQRSIWRRCGRVLHEFDRAASLPAVEALRTPGPGALYKPHLRPGITGCRRHLQMGHSDVSLRRVVPSARRERRRQRRRPVERRPVSARRQRQADQRRIRRPRPLPQMTGQQEPGPLSLLSLSRLLSLISLISRRRRGRPAGPVSARNDDPAAGVECHRVHLRVAPGRLGTDHHPPLPIDRRQRPEGTVNLAV